MVAAVTCFSGLDAAAKWTSQTLPPIETVVVRYLSGFLFITALVRPWQRLGVLRANKPALQCARALSLVMATVCSFTSLHYLPLGQVTAITFAAPLIVAGLAGPLLGERLGPPRIAAVLAGFAGVLIVARPGLDMRPAALVAVLTACASAVYALMTRAVAGHDRPYTTLFWSGTVGAAAVLPVLPFVWVPPPASVWLAMAGMGVLATLGHYLLILANERAPALILAPFTYAQLVGATVLGWLVFGDAPDRWTLLGGTIVAASGLSLLVLEPSKRPAASSLPDPPKEGR